jgi:HD-like signal output (HDOD) protein
MHRSDSDDIRNRLLVARLPAMPQILLKLIVQCQTEEVGMSALAELVSKDPGMAGKILSVANSSAYHRSGRKVGLEQSLMSLGVDMIKTLVISESVFQVFNGFSHSSSTDLHGFWKHSLSAAVMAREIAERMNYPHAEEAYLAGLLHDVGRLALLSTSPNEYAQYFQAEDDDELCRIEQEVLKMTHTEAGAWLVEHWNLDSFLADSVLYHHEPVARVESTHPLVRVVLLAHLLSVHGGDSPAVRAAGTLCGLEAKELAAISGGASTQVRKAAEYLGIDLSEVRPAPEASVIAAPEPKASDPVKEQLSAEVQNLVLSSEVGRAFTRNPSEAALLESVARSARLLFDFSDSIVLLMNNNGQALVGTPIGGLKQRLSEFRIALSGDGIIAGAARKGHVAFVGLNGHATTIAEEQIRRMLGAQSLICLPLVSGKRCLGMMIGGVASWQVPGLQRRDRLLRSFGEQAASAIEAATGNSFELSRRVASVAEEYRDASRKVVHEANNSLSIIRNYFSVLDTKLEKKELVVGEISILNEEIDRVGRIIKGLTDLKPRLNESVTEINRVIREVVRLFRDTEYVPSSVQIVGMTQDLPSEVEGGADKLKQILVNLIKNAIEAMPSGGEIHVANNGHVNRDGNLYVEVCVRDSGPGLPTDVLSTLFSPVQSTKGGVHQGLGLSIVHGLVKNLRGLIACRSGIRGTAFEILLPIHKRASPTILGRDPA